MLAARGTPASMGGRAPSGTPTRCPHRGGTDAVAGRRRSWLALWVCVVSSALAGCPRPSPAPTGASAAPARVIWCSSDGRGRAYIDVAQRRDSRGSLYVYEVGGALTAVSGRPAFWSYAGADLGTGYPMVTASRAGLSRDVFLLRPDGTTDLIAHGPFQTVVASPGGAEAALIARASGTQGVAGIMRPDGRGKRWQPTMWQWPDVRPLELHWTQAGDLLVTTVPASGPPGPCTLSLVDSQTGSREDLLTYDGAVPYVCSPSAGDPHCVFVLTSPEGRTGSTQEVQRLYVVDAQAAGAEHLASGRFSTCLPSPDGGSVVLARYAEVPDHLVVPDRRGGTGSRLRSRICVLDVGERNVSDLTTGEYVDMPFGFLDAHDFTYTRADGGRVSVRACGIDGARDRQLAPPESGEIRGAEMIGGEIVYVLETDAGVCLYALSAVEGRPRLIKQWR